MRRRLICWLLDVANDRPPTLARTAFYDIKAKLLQRYAEPDGFDVQHIVKDCWNCYGAPDGCYRCADGIYDQFWVVLNRWRWYGHVFHTPGQRVRGEPPGVVKIRGYIQHRTPRFYLAAEAWYWLALVYDRAAFRSTFGHTGYPSRKFTPMVVLGTVLFNWRMRRAQRSTLRAAEEEFPF